MGKASQLDREIIADALTQLGVGAGGGGKWSSAVESVKTSAYTVVAADAGAVIVGDSATPFAVSLTAAATLGAGFVAIVRNQGAGAVTIDPAGAETINAQATLALATGQAAIVMGNGTSFRALLLGESLASGGGGVVARVTFNGTGTPAIRQQFNVSSITDQGVGTYLVNFTSPLPTTDYQVSGGARGPAANASFMLENYDTPTRTANALGIYTVAVGGGAVTAIDCPFVSVVVHAN